MAEIHGILGKPNDDNERGVLIRAHYGVVRDIVQSSVASAPGTALVVVFVLHREFADIETSTAAAAVTAIAAVVALIVGFQIHLRRVRLSHDIDATAQANYRRIADLDPSALKRAERLDARDLVTKVLEPR